MNVQLTDTEISIIAAALSYYTIGTRNEEDKNPTGFTHSMSDWLDKHSVSVKQKFYDVAIVEGDSTTQDIMRKLGKPVSIFS